MLNLINNRPDSDIIYSYAKNTHKRKCKLLIDTRESVGLKHCNEPKDFIEYTSVIDDVYERTDEYKPNKRRKILILLGCMNADMLSIY